MCTHEYRRQRRRYKLKQYLRCGVDSKADFEPIIAEKLADPLYQLLVLHMIFCRLTENIPTKPRQPQGISHRTMRHPARHKN